MTLVQNWRRVLRFGWSVRFIALSGLLSGLELVLPLFSDSIPRGLFAVASVLTAIAATIARVVVQPQIERRATPRKPGEAADYD